MADIYDLLRELSKDLDLAEKFVSDPEAAMTGYDLTESQKTALKEAQEQDSMSPVCDLLDKALRKGGGPGTVIPC